MKKKAFQRPPSHGACPRQRIPFIWLLTLCFTEQLSRRNRKGLVGLSDDLPLQTGLLSRKSVPEGPPN